MNEHESKNMHFSSDVTVGLSQTVFSVVEDEGEAVVCTSVISGTTVGRTFSISYQTTDGEAQGKLNEYCILTASIFLFT